MTQQEKIIDKVKKLLALATSANENEAALAANKAQALLAEHNLSIADVEQKSSKHADIVADDNPLEGKPMLWKRQLGAAISRLYFCTYFYQTVYKHPVGGARVKVDRHSFVGTRDNALVAKMMFEYLTDTVLRLSKAAALTQPKHERGRYRRSFRSGATARLSQRLHERYLAAKAGKVKSEYTGTTLPALANLYDETERRLQEWMKQQFSSVRLSRSKGRVSHRGGWEAGQAAGERIGLDQQVKGAKPSGLIK
jgi:hypothetical protein